LSSKDAIHGLDELDIQIEFVSRWNRTEGFDFTVFSHPGVCTSPSRLDVEEHTPTLRLHICKCKNYMQEADMFVLHIIVEEYIGLIFFSYIQVVIFGCELWYYGSSSYYELLRSL
jgi:hypothetical protein